MPKIFLVLVYAITSCYALAEGYHERQEVRQFVDDLVATEGFTKAELDLVFSDAAYKQKIIDAISKPAEKVLTWKEYQDIFLTQRRVSEGLLFLAQQDEALSRAEQTFGVPKEVVVAILGVETMYGRFRGSYRVIDALSTLAFDYPPRADFFRKELKEFLLLAREEKLSPTRPMGSYAGAMGYGQFIPSSYRNFAVDFDGDGLRDIWENPVDAIGSVANYLAAHGWKRGEPITVTARLEAGVQVDAIFMEALKKPSASLASLKGQGVTALGPVEENLVAAPVLLMGKQGPEYWLGFDNFYAITRYNHSNLYAMAVFHLSEQLRQPASRGLD